MEKVLLVIENDHSIKDARYVQKFIKEYKGEVIEMTGFAIKTPKEIFEAVTKCTDIAVQTCFVNGSDQQFQSMVGLLSKISQSKNIYIALLGGGDNGLYNYFEDNLTPEEIITIEHHNVFAMNMETYSKNYKKGHIKLPLNNINYIW